MPKSFPPGVFSEVPTGSLPDLVLVVLQGLDHVRELVGDVQLMGVEQQYDPIHALSKPLQHRSKVIA